MKFIVSVVDKDDALPLADALVTNGYGITTPKNAGGFLRTENGTLFTCAEDEQVEQVVRLIQDNCHARIQRVGSLPPVMEAGESYVLGESASGRRGDLCARRGAVLEGPGQVRTARPGTSSTGFLGRLHRQCTPIRVRVVTNQYASAVWKGP